LHAPVPGPGEAPRPGTESRFRVRKSWVLPYKGQMSLSCAEVRNLMEPSGAALPFSEAQAEQVAEHLDQCPDCEERLGRSLGEALTRVPVPAGPSLPAVRALIHQALRRSTILRLGGLAAAALALAGTGWALLQHDPAPAGVVADRRPPVEAPIPDPPKLADLK